MTMLILATLAGAGAGVTGVLTWSYLTDWARAGLRLLVRVLRWLVRPVPPLRLLTAPHMGRHAGTTQALELAEVRADRGVAA